MFLAPIREVDTFLSNFIYQFRSPSLTGYMELVTFFGDVAFLLPASVLLVFFLRKKQRERALVFSSIFFISLIDLILKEFFRRPRPSILPPLVSALSYSYPSGHAMGSTVFFTTLSYFVWLLTKNKLITLITSSISLFLVLIIGISRVYLGVHYPSDILAGYVAGLVWFGSILIFENTKIFRKLYGST